MYNFVDTAEWIPVHTLPGYEACIEYFINNKGEVKSTKGRVERILKHKISNNGYPTVNLTQRIGRRGTLTTTVHKLVALAFLDQPLASPGKSKGCSRVKHLDGCKTNNAVSNLKWTKIEERDI